MQLERASGIYEIVCRPTGKRYVGSAVCFARRFAKHARELAGGKHHSRILQNAWNAYGAGAFHFTPLIVCGRDMLLVYEQTALDFYRPELNVLPRAGSHLGKRMSDEQKAKIGAANRKPRGSPLPAEVKAKISQALRGRRHEPMSEETKARISASRRGKYTGPRDRSVGEKISAALRGRRPSEQCLAASRAAHIGRAQTPEHVAKRVAAVAAKPRKEYARHSAEANRAKSLRQTGMKRSKGRE